MLINSTIAVKPITNDTKPLSMFSWPRLGPTVRSSTMSMGADKAPARNSSARLRASSGLERPVIWKRLLKDSRMVARLIASSARVLAIEGDGHGGAAVALIDGRGRGGDGFTGDVHALLQQHVIARASAILLGRGRHTARHGIGDVVFLIDHAELERRGRAKNLLGAGRVLHAWELHHDAVLALLLNHGFGHAELVDAITQGSDVL